jgi:hypothetical protein
MTTMDRRDTLTVPTTPTAIDASDPNTYWNGITIRAAATNTGPVYVSGDATMTAGPGGGGFQLDPGKDWPPENETDPPMLLSAIYFVAGSAGQVVTYEAEDGSGT